MYKNGRFKHQPVLGELEFKTPEEIDHLDPRLLLAEIHRLKLVYAEGMARKDQEHAREMAELKQTSADTIEELKQEHAREMARKDQEHAEKDQVRVREIEEYKEYVAKLERSITKLKQKVKDVRKFERKKAKAEIAKLKRTIKKMTKKMKKLEQADAYHDSGNTPLSRNSITSKRVQEAIRQNRNPTGRKQGGQAGHKPNTNNPKPDRTETVSMCKCPKCGEEKLNKKGTVTRIITTQKPRPTPVVVEYAIGVYDCPICGATDLSADHPEIPKNGNYSKGVQLDVVDNHLDRLPARKNADRIKSNGVLMSAATVVNILVAIGMDLIEPKQKILDAIRRSNLLHVDESTVKLSGKTMWIWLFHDPKTGLSLYVIRPSRGRNVLEEILGKDWKGWIVCDGWYAYKIYRIQRCWAHLLNEMRVLSFKNRDYELAAQAYEELLAIYDRAKTRVKKSKRKDLHSEVTKWLQDLISRHKGDPVLGKFMEKLERALPDAFHFVLDPRIPPTNNTAERELREFSVQKKIRGSFRSEKSMEAFTNMFTCVTSWKNQGLDYREQLSKYI